MISVLSNAIKTLTLELSWLFPLLSTYIKQLPIGGKSVAPLAPVGLFDLVDFFKSDGLPSPVLLLQAIFQFCKSSLPLLFYYIFEEYKVYY